MTTYPVEFSRLEEENAKLKAENERLQTENTRLENAGWYIYQQFSDYGRISNPDTNLFVPDDNYKRVVLDVWQQALKKDK
jgi:cell division protein FtsB